MLNSGNKNKDSHSPSDQPLHKKAAFLGTTIDINAEPLQHGDIEIGQGIIVILIERQVLSVAEPAAGEDDRQIAVVVTAAVHVRTHQDRGLLEKVGISFTELLQT